MELIKDDEKSSEASTVSQNLPMAVVERSSALVPKQPSVLWKILGAAKFVPLIMLLVATGGVIGLYFQPPGLQKIFSVFGLAPGGGTRSPIAVPVPPGPGITPVADKQRPVTGLGKLLPVGDVITIAPPFGAGDARIAVIKVKEGDRVVRGDVLAVLDNEKPLLATVETAKAAVATREAALVQVRAATLASRDEAKASLDRASAAVVNASQEFNRSQSLRQRGFVTEQAFQQRKLALDQARRDADRAQATLSRFSGDIGKQPDVIVAARNLDSAKADLASAQVGLNKAYVRAPVNATVLTITARPGERPGAQGIMNIGNIDTMQMEVEVYQTEIKRVRLGDAATASAESLPSELRGTVARIGLEVGRQTLVDSSPAANTDARVVKVTVTLDPESSQVARRFTNLQVTAKILSGSGR